MNLFGENRRYEQITNNLLPEHYSKYLYLKSLFGSALMIFFVRSRIASKDDASVLRLDWSKCLKAFTAFRNVWKIDSFTFSTGSPICWKPVPISLWHPARISFTFWYAKLCLRSFDTVKPLMSMSLIGMVSTTNQRRSSPYACAAFRAHCLKWSALKTSVEH